MNYTYSFYLRDHLGNNRMVVNASKTVEEVSHYYPYGGLFGENAGSSVQPYKYNFSIERGKSKLAYSSECEKNRPKVNGKELDRMNGLDLYDYGARYMDGALGRFTTMDPLCEKYYSVSPYAYCHNNPVNRIDLDGQDDYYTTTGEYLGSDNKKTDHIMISYLTYQIPFLSSYYQQNYQRYSIPIEYFKLNSIAYSNIFTDIVARDGEMDLSKIHNSRISVTRVEGQDNWYKTYSINDGPNKVNSIASTIKNSDDDIIITAFVFQDNKHPEEKNIFTTVSNVVNVLVGHEYNGHVINNYSDENNNHHVAFEEQMKHHSWEKTTEAFKQYEKEVYEQVKKREQ